MNSENKQMYDSAVDNLLKGIGDNYANWNGGLNSSNTDRVNQFRGGLRINSGRKFDKVVEKNRVWGFIAKTDGVLKIWVPHCFSPSAFGDSTHVRFFTFETFKQFDRQNQGSYYYDFHLDFVRSKMQIFRRWYQPNFFDRFLETLINLNQRKGERFLKILPYKEWEVYSEFRKLQ